VLFLLREDKSTIFITLVAVSEPVVFHPLPTINTQMSADMYYYKFRSPNDINSLRLNIRVVFFSTVSSIEGRDSQ